MKSKISTILNHQLGAKLNIPQARCFSQYLNKNSYRFDSKFSNSGNTFSYLQTAGSQFAIYAAKKLLEKEKDIEFAWFSGSNKNKQEDCTESMQYPANKPIEDKISNYTFTNKKGFTCIMLDGHAGWQVSDWASRNLHQFLDEEFELLIKENGKNALKNEEDVKKAITKSFDRVENYIYTLAKNAYDLGFGKLARVGSCCLCSVVLDDKQYVANIGDSRGMLILKNSDDNGLTFQKLNSMQNANSKKVQKELKEKFPEEEDVIYHRDKEVEEAKYVKNRQQPSRSFGDLLLKHKEFNNPRNQPQELGYSPPLEKFTGPYITHVPEIRTFDLTKKSVGFLQASDGLWDEMNFKDAQEEYKEGMESKTYLTVQMIKALSNAAKNAKLSYENLKKIPLGQRRDLHDDISMIFVNLKEQVGN